MSAVLLRPAPALPPRAPVLSRLRRLAASPRAYGLTLLGLVVLAALLRLPHLDVNPGWDGDEGYNLNIAANLAAGRHQMFALDFAFVQHPPFFFLLGAALLHLLPAGMTTLRLLAVVFALATLPLLAAVAGQLGLDRAFNRCAGLAAALLYTVLPLVVVQNRFAYTYNGLSFWTLLTLYFVLRGHNSGNRRALVGAGLAAAAALATDQEALYLLPVLLLCVRGTWERIAAPALALCGPALYLAVMFWSDRAGLLFDIAHTAGRVSGGSTAAQVVAWLAALVHFLEFDPFILPGLVGLALLPKGRYGARRVVLLLLATMLLVILKVRDPNPLFRAAEPLLPLICLGLGAVAARAWLAPAVKKRWVVVLAVCGLVFLGTAAWDGAAALTALPTSIPGLLPRSTSDAQAMAARVNRCLTQDDLVLSMPQVAWLFHAHTAEVLQAVAATGQASAFYPAGLSRARWVYDPRLAAARYLVVDDFTRAWIRQMAPERAIVKRAEATWTRVYAHGEYEVYENPARRPGRVACP